MNISNEGINLIKRFEGVRNRPYRDCVGLWTVGVGTTERRSVSELTSKPIDVIKLHIGPINDAVNQKG